MTEKYIDEIVTNPQDDYERQIAEYVMQESAAMSEYYRRESNVIHIYKDESRLDIIRGDQMEIRQQPWLWPGFIPRNTVTLFAGAGGIGKSQLLMQIAAYVAKGGTFKACGFEHEIEQGGVIYIDGENDINYQFAPKLAALDTDRKNIYYLRDMVTAKTRFRPIDLLNKIDLLEQTIQELKNIKLIIIDPIAYFIGNLKDHVSGEVCAFISSLNSLAKKYNLAIIINKHTRKKASGADSVSAATDEVAGSGAWVNAVRQSWVVMVHPEDKEKRLLCNLKVNIAKKSDEALVYRIKEKSVNDSEGKEVKTTILEWDDKTETINADDAMSKERYQKSKFEQGLDFVIRHLEENGQSLLGQIYEKGEKVGISRRTLERVMSEIETNHKKQIKVTSGIKGAKMLMLVSDY